MAKKGNRKIFYLECTVCKKQNYTASLSQLSLKEKKIEPKKLCPICKKHTIHKVVKI